MGARIPVVPEILTCPCGLAVRGLPGLDTWDVDDLYGII